MYLQSFERALIWIDQLTESGSKAPIVLIATKIDLPLSDHQVNSAVGILLIYV